MQDHIYLGQKLDLTFDISKILANANLKQHLLLMDQYHCVKSVKSYPCI